MCLADWIFQQQIVNAVLLLNISSHRQVRNEKQSKRKMSWWGARSPRASIPAVLWKTFLSNDLPSLNDGGGDTGPKFTIGLQLGWDLKTVKEIAYESQHFHICQTIQWHTLMKVSEYLLCFFTHFRGILPAHECIICKIIYLSPLGEAEAQNYRLFLCLNPPTRPRRTQDMIWGFISKIIRLQGEQGKHNKQREVWPVAEPGNFHSIFF